MLFFRRDAVFLGRPSGLRPRVMAIVGGVAAGAVVALAGLSGSYIVPLEHEAIAYTTRPVDDPAARLEKRLASGEIKLAYDDASGFLSSVLRALDVPVESQVLVFSKTSFQAPRIGPRTPRAIYFNDSVTVGWVRGGDVVEVAALDPKQGVLFYTLEQDPAAKPHLERRDSCLQCHAAGGTLGVPGLVVRSMFPEPSGMPLFHAGSFISDHRSPLEQRWGGWYVTGTHGSAKHMGNAVVRDRSKPDQLEAEGTQNLATLEGKFDTGAYLTPHSDIVALLVLEHQTHMTNLITRVGFETRMAAHGSAALNRALAKPDDELSESATRRINAAVEEMLEYMLFAGEAALGGRVRGTSGFEKTFAASGPRDRKGRSLRDFDLERRIFRHPLSYMIYNEAFDAMPAPARDRLYRRLFDVLTGTDKSPKYAHLTAADRSAIREILVDTKKGLPGYWTE